jgi:hypothetical protein
MLMNGFSIKSNNGLLRVLKSTCRVSQSFNAIEESLDCAKPQFTAMWDTGATTSAVTQEVVDACNLKPIGTAYLGGVHGFKKAEKYLANIYLPGDMVFCNVLVIKNNPPENWWDVLIGMDIIAAGEFSVTNTNSNTEFSFRFPPQQKADTASMHPIIRAAQKLQQPVAACLQKLSGR